MLDSRLSEQQFAELTETPVDWRNAWAGPVGSNAVCVYPDAAAALTSARPIEALGLATIRAAAEPMRREPSHRAEMISEIRGGEWLNHILTQDDWALVQGEDGYVGWIATWSLQAQSLDVREEQRSRLVGRFRLPLGTLWNSDHWASSPLWMGTPLLKPGSGLSEREAYRLVELASGDGGWMLDTEIGGDVAVGAAASVALDTARALLGTPYRWGGRTPTSLDCSGLVQICYELAAIRLPRDSAQQQLSGTAVDGDFANWKAGDLLLFGDPADHVGIYDGKGGMLHCRGFVRRDTLDAIGELMSRHSTTRRPDPRPAEPTLWMPRRDRA